jgi:tetratricopeptide (TPR) repeat protein
VVFDPEPVLALPSAHDHPSSARALLELSQRALERSELELATELIERALDAQRRLDPASGYRRFGAHLDVARFMLELERGNLAGMASIAFDGAEAARRDGEPIGSVAAWLTVGAYELAQIDPAGALQPATEALALARVSGAPSWIAQGLLALGMATATTDPDRAGELLEEVDRLGLHTLGLLINTLGLAAILSNWPLALRAAGRVLDLDRRTGVLPSSMLGFVLLGAGRALAPERPEAAAAMLGAMNRIQKESEAHGAEAPAARARGHFAEHLVEAGIDTNRIVREALGDSRARELRAQGMAMSRDEACAHARREIDAYLATLDEVRDD